MYLIYLRFFSVVSHNETIPTIVHVRSSAITTSNKNIFRDIYKSYSAHNLKRIEFLLYQTAESTLYSGYYPKSGRTRSGAQRVKWDIHPETLTSARRRHPPPRSPPHASRLCRSSHDICAIHLQLHIKTFNANNSGDYRYTYLIWYWKDLELCTKDMIWLTNLIIFIKLFKFLWSY